MSTSNAELASKLNSAGAQLVPSGVRQNITDWYKTNRKSLLSLVGGSEERAALFIASAFAQINRVPDLMQCNKESIYQCVVTSMGLNLLPGPSQECCFLPFSNEATFVPMYQGLVKLAYNSGFVTKIHGHVVWEADEFEYDPVSDIPVHKQFRGPQKDRGKRTHVYCGIKNIFRETQFTVLTAEDVQNIKSRSKGAKSSYSPWNSKYESDVDQMWLKTAFKRGVKWIKKDAQGNPLAIARALEIDNQNETGEVAPVTLFSEDVSEVLGEIADETPKPKEIEQ